MEENKKLYHVFVTLTLPDAEETAVFQLRLAPEDIIQGEKGNWKQLQNCSLSELFAYAKEMEESLWDTYRNITIQEFNPETVKIEGDLHYEEGLQYWVQLDSSPEVDELIEEAVEVVAKLPVPEKKEELPPKLLEQDYQFEHTIRIAGFRRKAGDYTTNAVDILINEETLRDTEEHALSSLDKEVAGVLIGPKPTLQNDGRYVVYVTDSLIAKHTKMHNASVTYTPESWRYITDQMIERYPNEESVIVGWYHTHPNFGIFLSEQDLSLHRIVFTQPWHIALVLDPVAKKTGFFCWNREQTRMERYPFPWPHWAPQSW